MGTETNVIRVMLVEDDAETREALAALIGGAPGVHCLAACPSAEAALATLQREQPDVLLMDIQLPRMSGIDCIRRVRQSHPQIAVVMLTVFEDHERIFQSLAAGAIGYIVKKTDSAKLLEAIRDAYAGGSPMSGQIAREVVRFFHDRPALAAAPTDSSLSRREQEVLGFLARGYLYKEIADQLAVSIGTVRTYIRRIYEKLHVRNRTEAVSKAFPR